MDGRKRYSGLLGPIEEIAELPDHCSLPSGTCKLTDVPSTCKSSSDMLRNVDVWAAPLAQMVNERCLHTASRYLGQRDADFKVAWMPDGQARMCRKRQLVGSRQWGSPSGGVFGEELK